MTKKIVFGAALGLLIVGIAAPSASAACNPPKNAATYNPSPYNVAYWHTSVPVSGATLIGKVWQGGVDFTGTCNTAVQAGQTRAGFLYFGLTPGDIGLSLALGDACVPGTLCPSAAPLFVQATVNNGTAQEFLVTNVSEASGGSVNYDFSQQGNHAMVPAPRPKINSSSRTAGTGGGTVNLGVHIDATAGGFFNGSGSDVTGYNIVTSQSLADPGRLASAYTLRQNVPAPGGAAADGATTVDCTNLGNGNQWVALQLVTVSGGPSNIVGPPTRIECNPALADPKFKVVPKPKVVTNSKAKH